MATEMMSYDPNQPFQIEALGFVLDSIQEHSEHRIVRFYRLGDYLLVALTADSMVVICKVQSLLSSTGNGILYAGNRPTCQYHGKILFEMFSAYHHAIGAMQ